MKTIKFYYNIKISNERSYFKLIIFKYKNITYEYEISRILYEHAYKHKLTINKNSYAVRNPTDFNKNILDVKTYIFKNTLNYNNKYHLKVKYKNNNTTMIDYYDIIKNNIFINLINNYKIKYKISNKYFTNDLINFNENVYNININLLHFMNLFIKLLKNKILKESVNIISKHINNEQADNINTTYYYNYENEIINNFPKKNKVIINIEEKKLSVRCESSLVIRNDINYKLIVNDKLIRNIKFDDIDNALNLKFNDELKYIDKEKLLY